jgi:predicted acylesterase/phospholipase RssA
LRPCGIVMKGGITSGVVYPLAITELAEEFRFREIGGTSAGAIAAAVTAAAEYRRVSTGSNDGFERLRTLPAFLAGTTPAGESNLLSLFPPIPPARRLFDFAAAFLGEDPLAKKVPRAVGRLLLISPLATIAAFFPALVGLAVLASQRSPWIQGALAVLELMAVVAGFFLVAAWNGVRAVSRTLPGHDFGLSTGMAGPERPDGVTQWLHKTIQETAGRTASDPPLTFGDLWAAEAPAADREDHARRGETDVASRAIHLQMITTSLTQGRPYRLPFDNRLFSFKPAELRAYFPDTVVDHLVAKGGPPAEGDVRALPFARDMPIVVAARMSLSFPILFSMVPLYAVDYTFEKNRQEGIPPQHERCWFIDGGLSSNFPVTLFDTPFPRWPTFCINLAEFHPQYPKHETDESQNVWMVAGHGQGRLERWTRLAPNGWRATADYVLAMLDTIRNWRDNTQLTVPGFRDRIGHVKLSRDEGGLNLKMDPRKVEKLSERGLHIGRKLRARFGAAGAAADGLNWNSHRWVRYQTAMALMQRLMRGMHAAFAEKDAAYPSYVDLVRRKTDKDPSTGSFWKTASAIPDYQARTERFLDLAQEVAASDIDMEPEAPRPNPELRVTPRL